MGRLLVAWLLAGVPAAGAEPPLERFEFSRVEMGVPTQIVLYAPDGAAATKAATAAFARIHALNAIMSDYLDDSELNRLCRTAGEGKAVPISEDLWKVLAHAQALSARSEGAFDVTVSPLVRLWRHARRQRELPSPDRLAAARALVDYRLVRLDPARRTVELLKPGMRLDLGGIAKGYATEEALKVLRGAGFGRAMVEAGGDIALGDPPPGRPGWRIGLAPLDAEDRPTSYLVLSRVAVATSGDSAQFVELNGRRYSHIVDPRTGLGLTDHSRVTVVAPSGLVADGLSTAVSVLGPEKGLKLIESTPGAAAMILRAPPGEKAQRYESGRWKVLNAPQGGSRSPSEGQRPGKSGWQMWPRGGPTGQRLSSRNPARRLSPSTSTRDPWQIRIRLQVESALLANECGGKVVEETLMAKNTNIVESHLPPTKGPRGIFCRTGRAQPFRTACSRTSIRCAPWARISVHSSFQATHCPAYSAGTGGRRPGNRVRYSSRVICMAVPCFGTTIHSTAPSGLPQAEPDAPGFSRPLTESPPTFYAYTVLPEGQLVPSQEELPRVGIAMSQASLPFDLTQLSVAERILLVEQIWDSIAAEPNPLPLTEAQQAELGRRLAAHEANPEDVVSWEESSETAR